MGTCEYVTEPERLANLLNSPEIEVTGILPVSNQILCVKWYYTKEAAKLSTLTNVVVAAFTTCQGRLKLFDKLHLLGKRALYYDTDSIFYVTDASKKDVDLPMGSMMGELTNELPPGCHIVSFVSGGPKFYAYKYIKPDGSFEYVCKVKGIRLNFTNSEKINFDSVREMILENNHTILINSKAIRRTQFHEVLTVPESKTCAPVYSKRRYVNLVRSYPFGYKKS